MMMDISKNHRGILRYVQSHLPTFLFGFGGVAIFLIIFILYSAIRGWYSFVLLGLVFLLGLVYFFVSSIWAAHFLYDSQEIARTFVKIGEIKSRDTIVNISLGRRLLAVDLCHHLTTGQVLVIDVYNPQMAPSRTLARWRQTSVKVDPDPRLSWRDGRISLLPMPDNSISAVTMSQVVSELWQSGDREQLMAETYRILAPGGSLLLAERMRTPVNTLVMGPSGLRLPPASYWNRLFQDIGLEIQSQISLKDIICCMQATKPVVDADHELG